MQHRVTIATSFLWPTWKLLQQKCQMWSRPGSLLPCPVLQSEPGSVDGGRRRHPIWIHPIWIHPWALQWQTGSLASGRRYESLAMSASLLLVGEWLIDFTQNQTLHGVDVHIRTISQDPFRLNSFTWLLLWLLNRPLFNPHAFHNSGVKIRLI